MPRISAAVSGSKTTGTSAVGTLRAPSRRRVRSAAIFPTASGESSSESPRPTVYQWSRSIWPSFSAWGVTEKEAEEVR